MAHASDQCLVRRGAAGDRRAFCVLISRHLGPLSTLIRYRVADSAGRDDVLQETLLLAWTRLPQLRDPDRVKAWLMRIAGNECTRYLRRNQPAQLSLETLPEQAASRYGRGAGPDRLLEELDLAGAVAALPDGQRELVLGFYIDGYTLRELAERGGYPVGTAKSRLHAARHHLRRALEE